MTIEEPCSSGAGMSCEDWEEEDFTASDAELWEQGLAQLSLPSTTKRGSGGGDEFDVHVRQKETWDCGIACLLMALRWLHRTTTKQLDDEGQNATTSNADLDSERRAWILETAGTESVWSIDLVSILEKYRKKNQDVVDFTYLFSSKTLEVDQEHKDLKFYEKAFGDDEARVSKLFARAQRKQWNLIVQHQLRLDQVLELVCRPDCIAIALVDNNTILAAQKRKKGESEKKKKTNLPFAGHYIVLSGLSRNGEMQIHNPAISKKIKCMSLALFEKAWRAQGTDNDILFLVRQ
jgi:hypothetical protein